MFTRSTPTDSMITRTAFPGSSLAGSAPHRRGLSGMLGLLTLAGTLTLAACGDDPMADDHDDHSEPVGVEVRAAGQVLASASPTSATGTLSVAAGEETMHLDVVFVTEDGDAVVPDDDEFLEVVVGDGSVAEWEQDTPGEFGGHLHGEAAGTTTVIFRLMHGAVGSASAHADFISAPITVTIN